MKKKMFIAAALSAVATLLIAGTGWGQAMATTVTRVLITNTTKQAVPVLDTGTTIVVTSGTKHFESGDTLNLVGSLNTSPYSSVTLYVTQTASDLECTGYMNTNASYIVSNDPFPSAAPHTFSPTPPVITITCTNGSSVGNDVTWMVTGRT